MTRFTCPDGINTYSSETEIRHTSPQTSQTSTPYLQHCVHSFFLSTEKHARGLEVGEYLFCFRWSHSCFFNLFVVKTGQGWTDADQDNDTESNGGDNRCFQLLLLWLGGKGTVAFSVLKRKEEWTKKGKQRRGNRRGQKRGKTLFVTLRERGSEENIIRHSTVECANKGKLVLSPKLRTGVQALPYITVP